MGTLRRNGVLIQFPWLKAPKRDGTLCMCINSNINIKYKFPI